MSYVDVVFINQTKLNWNIYKVELDQRTSTNRAELDKGTLTKLNWPNEHIQTELNWTREKRPREK